MPAVLLATKQEESRIMRKSITMKAGAVGTAFVLAGGLAVIASGTTGAYFSETKTGAMNGTIGSVHLSTSETTFNWNGIMPGVRQPANVEFTNTGTGPQDFYLVFPNATALSALNSGGRYGEVHISVNGVEKFASKNLNDNPAYTCVNREIDACPVPQKMLLASDVAKDAVNAFKFEFNYPATIGNGWQGLAFNHYPVSDHQFTVNAADGIGAGLPFSVVAVQVGQQP